MDIVDLGEIAALLSVPTALVAAWWTKRSAESATSAALLAGRIQADTAISAVQAQSLLHQDQQRHIALGTACMEFLNASRTLVSAVKRLPSLDHDERQALMAKHAISMEIPYASLEFLAPPDVLTAAERLLSQCRLLERCALDRAVLRATISALEAGWCPGDPENCTDDRHNSAYVAWEFLVGWARKDEEGSRHDRDLLDYCLRDSATFTEMQVARALSLADRCPAMWDRLIGGWVRDPLMEGLESHHTDFVTAARAANLTAPLGLFPSGLEGSSSPPRRNCTA
ncbi:hypothetical protein GCM10011583_71710 [Streptomyces camponoticapitis]|uniref:Uncharacterized protein n=1 Tax=Streptomyces camponoticapitis TaxID=1616125 RepID=A0ABQ2EXA1_9ACTN|nr:hypothetical protein [Streptomyces camponoticapitis]GGK29416.1 hypothetical protein GCM10011583_71710 [Streptomyces camponoticapitis]